MIRGAEGLFYFFDFSSMLVKPGSHPAVGSKANFTCTGLDPSCMQNGKIRLHPVRCWNMGNRTDPWAMLIKAELCQEGLINQRGGRLPKCAQSKIKLGHPLCLPERYSEFGLSFAGICSAAYSGLWSSSGGSQDFRPNLALTTFNFDIRIGKKKAEISILCQGDIIITRRLSVPHKLPPSCRSEWGPPKSVSFKIFFSSYVPFAELMDTSSNTESIIYFSSIFTFSRPCRVLCQPENFDVA